MDLLLPDAESFEDSIDAVPGQSEDCIDSPCDKAFDEYV
jgi:hypothetical protein